MPEDQEEEKAYDVQTYWRNDIENTRAVARSLIEINQILNENQ